MPKERSKRAKQQQPVVAPQGYSLWTVPYEARRKEAKELEDKLAKLDLKALMARKMPERSKEMEERLRMFESRLTDEMLLRRIY